MFTTLIIIALVSLVVYIKWRQTYWKRRGIMQIDPINMFGTSKKTYSSSISEASLENYLAIKSAGKKHGGIYFFIKPIYMPIDPEIIKHILQKDFIHFTDHGNYHHPKDIVTMNLFNLGGESWKQLRAKLTPTFTSGKMKMMFETLAAKTGGLEKQLEKHAGKGDGIDVKDILGRFTTDVIASCAFGIENNSLEDPDNEFRKFGQSATGQSLRNKIRFLIINIVPSTLLAPLGFRVLGQKTTDFFINVVKETIKTRESNEIFRKDFMHLLLQLKNQGVIRDSSKLSCEAPAKEGIVLSDEEIVAQCFIFFLAGFETSATTMTFALLEIAQHSDIQSKLRNEINYVLEKYNNQMTYDAVMEMKYLDMVVNEVLRKFPPVPALPRICTKKYNVPGTDLVLEKGTTVNIPIWGLHRDPEYYPNPEKFNPENFSDENRAKRPDMTFLPFGEGPRMCIGLRFGLLQSKVGLITILRNFKISLNKKTRIPVTMHSRFVLSIKGDLWINVERIQ